MATSKVPCKTCGGELVGATFDGFNRPVSYICNACHTLHTARYTGDGDNMGKVTQGEAQGATATRPELLEKLRRLNEREAEVSAQKKGEMKAFNDQLKDLKDEKKTVLEALKKTAAPEKK